MSANWPYSIKVVTWDYRRARVVSANNFILMTIMIMIVLFVLLNVGPLIVASF